MRNMNTTEWYMWILTHLIRGIGSILKWMECVREWNTMTNGCCCCYCGCSILVHLFLTQHTNDNGNNNHSNRHWMIHIHSLAYFEPLKVTHSRSIIMIYELNMHARANALERASVIFIACNLHRDSITLELEYSPFDRNENQPAQHHFIWHVAWLWIMAFFWLVGWLVLLLELGGNRNKKIITMMICFDKWSMIAMILISDTREREKCNQI